MHLPIVWKKMSPLHQFLFLKSQWGLSPPQERYEAAAGRQPSMEVVEERNKVGRGHEVDDF